MHEIIYQNGENFDITERVDSNNVPIIFRMPDYYNSYSGDTIGYMNTIDIDTTCITSDTSSNIISKSRVSFPTKDILTNSKLICMPEGSYDTPCFDFPNFDFDMMD